MLKFTKPVSGKSAAEKAQIPPSVKSDRYWEKENYCAPYYTTAFQLYQNNTPPSKKEPLNNLSTLLCDADLGQVFYLTTSLLPAGFLIGSGNTGTREGWRKEEGTCIFLDLVCSCQNYLNNILCHGCSRETQFSASSSTLPEPALRALFRPRRERQCFKTPEQVPGGQHSRALSSLHRGLGQGSTRQFFLQAFRFWNFNL